MPIPVVLTVDGSAICYFAAAEPFSKKGVGYGRGGIWTIKNTNGGKVKNHDSFR